MNRAKNDLSADEVRHLFDYDPETGDLIWRRRDGSDPKTNTWNTRFAGKPAGAGKRPYVIIGLRGHSHHGRDYPGHRLVWLHVYGRWPESFLDHIDGNGRNNRLSNLREATPAENGQNRRPVKNASGLPGALFRKADGAWWSTIKVQGKPHFLGTYPTKEAAHIAYVEAKKLLHTFNPTLRGEAKSRSR